MSYRARSLGYDLRIDFPGVGEQHVDLPLERMVDDTGTMLMQQAEQKWLPAFQERVLPPILAQAEQHVLTTMMPRVQQVLDDTISTLQLRMAVVGVGLIGLWWASQRLRAA